MYFDFQKIERKKSKRALFWAPFPFFGVTLCGYLTPAQYYINSYNSLLYNTVLVLVLVSDSRKMLPRKMALVLRKALVSIFSAQFFENQNAWNTTLVYLLTENPKMHRWDTILWQELISVVNRLFQKGVVSCFDILAVLPDHA